MKKTLLATSLICSGLALGSLSENAKADDSQPVNPNSNQGQTQANTNSSTLINKQSITLQQPSENNTNTILSSFTKDSGISTTQDGVSYTVNPQNDGYQIELSQDMGQYNHLLAIYNYNPTTHTYKQIGGTYQADVPMGESLKQNNGNQESSKPVNSQQLGLTNEATWQDPDGSVHNVNSDGLDHYYNAQTKTYQYQDWSGVLPNNAVIKDSDNVQHMTHQEYKQSLQSQPQQNSQQYGNGLFTKDNQPQPTTNQPSQSNSSDQTTNQSSQAKELPQTGNANSKAGLGVLALASLTTMFALGKRKEKY